MIFVFDMRDFLLDVLLHDDGARLFSWSFSEHGPQQANENAGILEVAWTRPSHDLESHLPAIVGFFWRHRHTDDIELHDTTYPVIVVVAGALYVSIPSLT